jgi:hypothetical protein
MGFKVCIKRFTFYGLANATGKVVRNLRGNRIVLTLTVEIYQFMFVKKSEPL